MNVIYDKMLTQKDLLLAKIKCSLSPVIICGADNVGKALFDICIEFGINVEGFSDYKPNLTGTLFCGRKVYYTSEISKTFEDAVYIISVMSIGDVVDVLEGQGIKSWYAGGILLDGINTVQSDTDSYQINREKFEIESCKISHRAYLKQDYVFLRSIDLMITERCSLRCQDCSNLMQYFKRPKDFDLDELFKMTNDFLQYVDELMEIRILGGDAFMNRDWPKILDFAVSFDKVKRVLVYTNGLIVPKLEDIPILAHEKVVVYFTNYGKLSRNLSKITELFKEHKVWHKIDIFDTWIDCATIEKHNRTDDQNDKLFMECVSTSLVTLANGKVFRCPYSASAFLLGAVEDCPTDYVNIHELARNKTHANIGKRLVKDYITSKKALSSCDYCTSRILANEITPAIQVRKPLEYEKVRELEPNEVMYRSKS